MECSSARLATEYRVATATGTYAACGTLSIGNQWAAAIATYKVAPTPKLTVTKIVDNTGGGTKQEGDFPLFLDGNPVVSGQQNTTTVGPHTVSETTDPNYTAVIGGDCASDGTITLAATDVKTCTITNTFKAPKLTVQKLVDNTGGGTKQPGDFPLFVDGTPVTNNQQITTTVGPHTVSETTDPDYTAVIGGDCAANGSITLAAGDVKTCTITNTFKAPKLTVQKLVDNTGGGTKQPGDFPLFVDGTPVTNNQQITTTVGPHTVSETQDPNYTAVIGGDCAANGSITLAAGDVKTCTITNTFNGAAPATATLIVVKHVVNNNGGTKNAGDFTMQVTGSGASPSSFPGSESGTTVTLNAGAYSVAEVAVANYFATFSADCSGTIAAGETRTCTVTNSDFRPAPPTFCQKTAVTSLLSPSNRRFLNNKGIDNLVRVDLGESIQDAVDTAADTNGDGYILIGVIANATGALGGHTSQTVVINRAYALPFALIGCSVTLHDPNRGDGQPTARIAASASSPTTPNNPASILVMDLHANDSDAAGWLVEGNRRELRNVSVSGNATGISVVGDGNTVHNAVVNGNQGIGISVQGHNNLTRYAERDEEREPWHPGHWRPQSSPQGHRGRQGQGQSGRRHPRGRGWQPPARQPGQCQRGQGIRRERRHQRCPEPAQEQPVQYGGQRDGERRRRVRAAQLCEERRRRQQGRRDRGAEDLGAREVPGVPGGERDRELLPLGERLRVTSSWCAPRRCGRPPRWRPARAPVGDALTR